MGHVRQYREVKGMGISVTSCCRCLQYERKGLYGMWVSELHTIFGEEGLENRGVVIGSCLKQRSG